MSPHTYRWYAAERAIQTFKNYLSAGLASCNPKFALREWNKTIPQYVLALNLLHNTRMNPKIAAYTYLFGNFDFNKSPLTPPGTCISTRKKLSIERLEDFIKGICGQYDNH